MSRPPSSSTRKQFYYAGDLLVAKERAGVRSYYHLDHLGSPHAITDATPAESGKYEYAPFGKVRARTEASGLANRRGFTGHQDGQCPGADQRGGLQVGESPS